MNARQSALSTKQRDYIACAYLFSPEHAKKDGFIENLKIDVIKKAFREKAKRYHPDLHPTANDDMIARRKERFVRITESYEHLFNRIKSKEPAAVEKKEAGQAGKAKIIAVGGAKGGIGKSILTSNLSVYLSRKGFNTVAVDLDLGGANLHLFLGKTVLKNSINDFLSNRELKIDDVMESTKYGPRLIGGDSSRLGAANISFTQKLKLLRTIRNLEADYVIVDLGGDTSYNVIDFFLAADMGIVMTTCDPAAYLDAYSFIKTALYRKLNRIYGPESLTPRKNDPVLKQMILQTIMSEGDPRTGDIERLIQRVKDEHPSAMETIQDSLDSFKPQLLVNKALNEKAAIKPVKRIQEVALKKLSIHVGYLCAMPFQLEVENSARTLVPCLSSRSDIPLAQAVIKIAAATRV